MRSLHWLRQLSLLLPLSLSLTAAGSLTGCTTEAACFANCHGVDEVDTAGKSSGGSGGSGIVIGVGGTAPSLGGSTAGPSKGGTGGALEPTPEVCDDVDLQTDLDNCGECGNHCAFVGADASCLDGECVMGTCDAEHHDLDGDQNNGCEYVCVPSNGGVELCNTLDEDCDGVADNGFDLTTDAQNCGVCMHSCELLHASSDCDPGTGSPSCVVLDCETGWYNNDGVDANGCEYSCVKTGVGGVPCDPADTACGQELCDEYDNDCNGVINDGHEASGGPEGGTPCTDFCEGGVCKGQCTAGLNTCVGTQLVCVPGQGPSLEVCDNQDNDCDGKGDDEEFNFSNDPNNCGACGVSCSDALPNAVAQCVDPAGAPPPACQILACKPGYKDNDSAIPGCEQCPKFPTSAETCNGIDDDCDGVVDNAAAIAAQKPATDVFCNRGKVTAGTPCAGTTVSCGGTSGWICNYPANMGVEVDPVTKKVPVIEQLCDAIDGNCDGQKDEAFLNKGQSCEIGQGACSRTAVFDCKPDHSGTACTAQAVATDAKDELCNGLDDNCDGQVDERTPVSGSLCYNGGSHACLGYKDPMVAVGSTWIYQFEASRPDATAVDAGTNTLRSCSKSSVLPWTSISQVDAEAACAAVPTSDGGTKMRLCDETEWQAACLAGQAGTSPTWSFSATPTTYAADVCNDAAAGIAAPWATAFDNGAAKRCRTSTSIWDMSGNVAEWTGSCITVLGKDYCRVRGGSFLSLGPATACGFSFVLDKPDFLNFDLGFRCCSDAAP